MNSTNDDNDTTRNQIIKKEARGLGDSNLGQIKEVSDEYVITEKGILDKR
ncbi:MAG TPA: hypothetical protein VHJ38_19685 [Nitrososphaeraceae archaeon]|jgi:hypothetical protein|nr:hypothetical protein [Nitrososphaeraceae archaeon]